MRVTDKLIHGSKHLGAVYGDDSGQTWTIDVDDGVVTVYKDMTVCEDVPQKVMCELLAAVGKLLG